MIFECKKSSLLARVAIRIIRGKKNFFLIFYLDSNFVQSYRSVFRGSLKTLGRLSPSASIMRLASGCLISRMSYKCVLPYGRCLESWTKSQTLLPSALESYGFIRVFFMRFQMSSNAFKLLSKPPATHHLRRSPGS